MSEGNFDPSSSRNPVYSLQNPQIPMKIPAYGFRDLL